MGGSVTRVLQDKRTTSELPLLLLICCFLCSVVVDGDGLSNNHYELSCPQLESIVREAIIPIFLHDPSAPAALLRPIFRDYQVQGCASILLDSGDSEMVSAKNFGIRHWEVIGILKSLVEAGCPGQVSCADMAILAARDAVAMSGGPDIRVLLGRRDSVTSSNRISDASLPSANAGVDGMLNLFTEKGLTLHESVAILGAHTLGVTHCHSIMERLRKQDTAPLYLKLSCPHLSSLVSNFSFIQNDLTSFIFDNHYFRDSMAGQGVLRIDADMAMDPRTAPIIALFAIHQNEFFKLLLLLFSSSLLPVF